MKRLIILFGITLSVFSCQKIEFEESKCEMVEGDPSPLILFDFPCFNPNNSDEIVFIYGDYTYQSGNAIIQLVRHNWKSGKSEVIKEFDSESSYNFKALSWSKSDWIAYILDEKVRVIKSDGSEYNDLGIKANDLKFGDDGLLYYSLRDLVPPSMYFNYLFSYDFDRKSIDTVAFIEGNYGEMYFDVSQEHKFFCFYVYNAPLKKGEKVDLKQYYDVSWIGNWHDGDIVYSTNGDYIYFTQGLSFFSGIKRMHIASKSVENIKPECSFYNYGQMSLSKDAKFMVVEKRYAKPSSSFPIPIIKREIVIIDLATMNEKAISY